MGVIETAKEAVALVQKLDNIELVKTILSLQQQCYDLVFENRELKEKLLKAEETLSMQTALKFRGNAYWLGAGSEEQDGPICSRCWDSDHKVVRMTRQTNGWAACANCKHGFKLGPDRESPLPYYSPGSDGF
jgi:hypothetical protein